MEDFDLLNLNSVLIEFADYFVEQARKNLKEAQPFNHIASGALYNNIQTHVKVEDMEYEVSVDLEDYWIYLEKGTKPHYAPIEPLRKWVQIKPVLPRVMTLKNGKQILPTVEQLPYIVRAKIARDGTPATNFFKEAKEDALKLFEEKIQEALVKDVTLWIQTNLSNFLII